MRVSPLQVNEPAVAAAIEAQGRQGPAGTEWRAIFDLDEHVAPERGRRGSQIDRDLLGLSLAIAQSPDVIGGDRSGSHYGCRGFAYLEPALDNRISALEADRRPLLRIATAQRHQVREAGVD